MISRSTLLELNWSSVRSIFRQSSERNRGLFERRKSDSSTGPTASSVEERDKKIYGGWKSYDLLVESGQEPSRSFVKRWDWHLWQFIVSLMPATGIYLVAKSIEADRQKELLDAQNNNEENQRILILPGQHAEKQRAAAAAKDDVDGPPSLQRMKERLDAVEDMLSGLLNQQTAGSSGNTKPSATASKSEEKAK